MKLKTSSIVAFVVVGLLLSSSFANLVEADNCTGLAICLGDAHRTFRNARAECDRSRDDIGYWAWMECHWDAHSDYRRCVRRCCSRFPVPSWCAYGSNC